MKKVILAVITGFVLTACSTTDKYDRRAEEARKRQEAAAQRAVDKAPQWMNKLPESTNAVYASGSAVSQDFSMADMKAKNIALASICMAAGGEVDKSSKIYMMDNGNAGSETSEVAIRAMCRRVDVSGAELVEIVRIPENGRYRSYVLMSLPTGEANAIQKRKDQLKANEAAATRSKEAFQELDQR